MKRTININARAAGQSYKGFLTFIALIRKKEAIEVHGPEFVIMSLERYSAMMRRIYRDSHVTITQVTPKINFGKKGGTQ